jgi:hypothetical protein
MSARFRHGQKAVVFDGKQFTLWLQEPNLRIAVVSASIYCAIRKSWQLPLQQVIRPDERERWPRGNHPTNHTRLSDENVSDKTGQASDEEQRPREPSAAPP